MADKFEKDAFKEEHKAANYKAPAQPSEEVKRIQEAAMEKSRKNAELRRGMADAAAAMKSSGGRKRRPTKKQKKQYKKTHKRRHH